MGIARISHGNADEFTTSDEEDENFMRDDVGHVRERSGCSVNAEDVSSFDKDAPKTPLVMKEGNKVVLSVCNHEEDQKNMVVTSEFSGGEL